MSLSGQPAGKGKDGCESRSQVGSREPAPLAATETYWCELCRECLHPGGLHVIDQWEPRGDVRDWFRPFRTLAAVMVNLDRDSE